MTNHTPSSTAEESTPVQATSENRSTVIAEYHPTLTPTLIWLAITILVGVTVLVYLLVNPTLFGDPQLTEIAVWVTAIIVVIAILRLLIKLFILRRITYLITDTELRREYQLLYRFTSREIPLRQLRGIELTQDRIQTLLGYGDVTFLTGGTNQSLGFLEFENLDNPAETRDEIRTLAVRNAPIGQRDDGRPRRSRSPAIGDDG